MRSEALRILLEALRIPPDDRTQIVVELLASLGAHGPDEGRSKADWIREIERRARAAIAGSVGLCWSEVRTQIESRLPGR
jgi:hypothetical protein